MPSRTPSSKPVSAAEKARKERLAEALRANLKRRKSQARDRKEDDTQAGEPRD
jgi:hypothetical protein